VTRKLILAVVLILLSYGCTHTVNFDQALPKSPARGIYKVPVRLSDQIQDLQNTIDYDVHTIILKTGQAFDQFFQHTPGSDVTLDLVHSRASMTDSEAFLIVSNFNTTYTISVKLTIADKTQVLSTTATGTDIKIAPSAQLAVENACYDLWAQAKALVEARAESR